jgi:hypothetical protein
MWHVLGVLGLKFQTRNLLIMWEFARITLITFPHKNAKHIPLSSLSNLFVILFFLVILHKTHLNDATYYSCPIQVIYTTSLNFNQVAYKKKEKLS